MDIILSGYEINDDTFAIGFNNKLLKICPEDLDMFKFYTKNTCLLMGRKTYESLNGLLYNRLHCVLSKTLQKERGVLIFNSLIKLKFSNITPDFCIGGAKIINNIFDYYIIKNVYINCFCDIVPKYDTTVTIPKQQFKRIVTKKHKHNEFVTKIYRRY